MTKRNALITGGARGIGAATAKALAEDGHRVFINFVKSNQAATELAKEIQSKGGEAIPVQADVRDDAQLKAMFDQITSAHGGVDILVSNANMQIGWSRPGKSFPRN